MVPDLIGLGSVWTVGGAEFFASSINGGVVPGERPDRSQTSIRDVEIVAAAASRFGAGKNDVLSADWIRVRIIRVGRIERQADRVCTVEHVHLAEEIGAAHGSGTPKLIRR